MKRRSLLAALGGVVSTAGCLRTQTDGGVSDTDPTVSETTDAANRGTTVSRTGSETPTTVAPRLAPTLTERWDKSRYGDEVWPGDGSFYFVTDALIKISTDGDYEWSSSDLDRVGYASELDWNGNLVALGRSRTAGNRGRVLTFDTKNGDKMWDYKLPTDGKHTRVTHLTVTDGSPVVVGSKGWGADGNDEPHAHLYGIDRSTGWKHWERSEFRATPLSGLSIHDGRLYATVGNDVLAIDPENGEQVATTTVFSDDSVRVSGMTIDGGTMYTASNPTKALTLPELDVSWSGDVVEDPTVRPVVDGGVLVTGTGSGDVVALDAESGRRLWRGRTSAPVFGTLDVWNGYVWLTDEDGTFYAFDLDTGEKLLVRSRSGVKHRFAIVDDVLCSSQASKLVGYGLGTTERS